MHGRKVRAQAADLSRAIVRFEHWRQGRAAGSRIPASLWKLAVNVAGRHGVARTAGALKLDYYSLKNRVVARPSPVGDAGHSSPPPVFVELAPGPLSSLGPCVIEFSDCLGSTLRVQLPASHAPDLVALGRSFWGGR